MKRHKDFWATRTFRWPMTALACLFLYVSVTEGWPILAGGAAIMFFCLGALWSTSDRLGQLEKLNDLDDPDGWMAEAMLDVMMKEWESLDEQES